MYMTLASQPPQLQEGDTRIMNGKLARQTQSGKAHTSGAAQSLKHFVFTVAFLALMIASGSVAKADCIVLNTTPVSSLSGTVGPSVTNFATNVANTQLTQGGPAIDVLLGTLGPNLSLNPLTLTNASTLSVTVNFSGTGATLTPPSVTFVGTYNVALASFTFAPAHVSFTCIANDCGSFDVNINPLALSALLSGGTLNASLTNVLCGSCAPAPVPEPATIGLFGTGLGVLAGIARRRRRLKLMRSQER